MNLEMLSSSGTFAVVSIMVGKCVNKFSNINPDVISNTTDTTLELPSSTGYSPIQIATLICFMVGVIQVTSHNIFNA